MLSDTLLYRNKFLFLPLITRKPRTCLTTFATNLQLLISTTAHRYHHQELPHSTRVQGLSPSQYDTQETTILTFILVGFRIVSEITMRSL